jgi:hypothetical protein
MIPGANVFLLGPTGSGKTHSQRTWIDAGVTPFIIFTEPHGAIVVGDIPCPKLHFSIVTPTTGTWDELVSRAETMTKASWSMLSQMTVDADKSKYQGYLRLVTMLHNFTCMRCNKSFGDVGSWDSDRAIILDSLSGLNEMAFQMVSGESIARTQPMWGAAMNAELKLSNKLCMDTKCHYVLTAHLKRQQDLIHGGSHISANALGQASDPDWPKLFSDIICTVRDGDKFSWSTAEANMDLKGVNVPPAAVRIPPSFVEVINGWKRRGGIIPSQTQVQSATGD